MSNKRPTITARMKVDCLLHRVILQFGRALKDFEGNDLNPGAPVVFDHVHGLGAHGPHIYQNLRPALKSANDAKARDEARDYHHVRRLRGKSKCRTAAKIPSSSFPDRCRSIPSSQFRGRS